jgi:ASCH domain
MKALSIRQPWALLIIHGGKDIENRKWNTKYRGPILIHAAKANPRPEIHAAEQHIRNNFANPSKELATQVLMENWAVLQLGGIVGSAILSDVVTQSDSPWFTGPFGFVLTDIKSLPFRPMRGMLGLFEVPG